MDNLLIVKGDAKDVFADWISSASVAKVFVNYPNPPIWRGSNFRLIDHGFLAKVRRALTPQGVITLVTDDPSYAVDMVGELGSVLTDSGAPGFKTALPDDQALATAVPDDYGGSYFDSYWASRKRGRRFYIEHTKQ